MDKLAQEPSPYAFNAQVSRHALLWGFSVLGHQQTALPSTSSSLHRCQCRCRCSRTLCTARTSTRWWASTRTPRRPRPGPTPTSTPSRSRLNRDSTPPRPAPFSPRRCTAANQYLFGLREATTTLVRLLGRLGLDQLVLL